MWMGPLVLSLFFLELGWLPGPAEPDAAFALLLPSLVVGTHLMAMLSRMTRSSLVEVLREDFMTTARAKGLPEWLVVVKHGLRNALLPVITVAGLQFGGLARRRHHHREGVRAAGAGHAPARGHQRAQLSRWCRARCWSSRSAT